MLQIVAMQNIMRVYIKQSVILTCCNLIKSALQQHNTKTTDYIPPLFFWHAF